MSRLLTMIFIVGFTSVACGQKSIPEGSRVYVAPMGGFESNLIAALDNKKVPVVVVGSRSTADFEVGGGAESQKASWMRIWVSGTWRSDEKASIVVKNLHTDVIVYAYEVNKWAAWHGSQSAAEACAKHIKSSIVRVSPEELARFSASPHAKTDESDVGSAGGSSADMSVPALGLSATTRADDGAEITKTVRQGVAESFGLHVGEVIISVDGKRVSSVPDLNAALADRKPGSTVRLGYMFPSNLGWMPGQEKVLTLTDGNGNR